MLYLVLKVILPGVLSLFLVTQVLTLGAFLVCLFMLYLVYYLLMLVFILDYTCSVYLHLQIFNSTSDVGYKW